MFRNSRYRILFVGTITLLIMVTVLAFAIQPKIFAFLKTQTGYKPPVNTPVKPKVYDEALLKKLDEVFRNLDFSKPAYTLSGSITVINKEDSTETMKNVFFLMCKNNNEFYYKQAGTETINQDGVYISINNQTKKIFISKQKEVNTASIIDVEKLRDALQSEKYELKSSIRNSQQTISMSNEYHISCKEYNLTFDTLTNKPTRIYMRLTNLRDPLNKSKDKIIDINIARLDNDGKLDEYVTKNKIVYKNGKNWKLTSKYDGYELIQL